MTDVSLWVPVMTAGASIIAVTIPLVINAIRDDRREQRDHEAQAARDREARTGRLRGDCARLLRAAQELRVLVSNDVEFNGPSAEKVAEGWKIRRAAGDMTAQADQIGMLDRRLDAAAEALAAAAAALVPSLNDRGRVLGGSTVEPDFVKYEQCVKDFKAASMDALADLPVAAGWPAPDMPEPASPPGGLSFLRAGLRRVRRGRRQLVGGRAWRLPPAGSLTAPARWRPWPA